MSCAEQLDLLSGQISPVDPVPLGPFQQRVVDVGDVLHVVHLVAGVEPDALHQVEGQVGRGVAEVCRVVRGDAADVDPGGRNPGWSDAPYPSTSRTDSAHVLRIVGQGRNRG